MLTPEQRSEIKALIEERIAELEANIPRLEERVAPVSPDSAIGRLSRTDSMMNAGTVGLALKDSRTKLTRLRNRLAALDNPDFDQCGFCNNPIGWERLLAAPDRGICAPCLNQKRK